MFGPARELGANEPIEAVLVHPPINLPYIAFEMPTMRGASLGNALACDCIVVRFHGRPWMGMYDGAGRRNEDWYGFGASVLAPFDGGVEAVTEPKSSNRPGELGPGEHVGWMLFRRDDGTRVIYAHVRDIGVKVGDRVEAGDVVARVGNNGSSRQPHIHVGAWRNDEALQVRFDQRALASLWNRLDENW